jgi:hypothetical protein
MFGMSVQKYYTSDPITSHNVLLLIMKNHVFTKRKGISTVLTTVIILVASVVLGSGVVLYGTSLFQTVAQEQSIDVQGIQIWVNATDATGDAWGAAGVRNNGDQVLAVDSIGVKGAIVPFSSWWVDTDQTRVTVENFQNTFNHTGTDASDGNMMRDSVDSGGTISLPACTSGDPTTLEIDLDGDTGPLPTLCLEQASGPMGLSPGERGIIYFQIPAGKVTTLDAGAATTLKIFAGEAGAPLSTIIRNP